MKRFLLALCAAAVLAAPTAAAREKKQAVVLKGPGLVTARVEFGAVPVGGQKTVELTLVNGNSQPMWIGLHFVDSPVGAGFDASWAVCPPAPLQPSDPLQPGDSCTLRVSMTGEATGHYTGKVGLVTDSPSCPAVCGPDAVITLRGVTRRG